MRHALGWASVVAGLLHGALAPAHFAEWWGYGAFFAVAGASQVLFGLAVLTDAFGERRAGCAFLLGAVANSLFIGLYVWTRTLGIPFAGPAAGEVEGIAPLDVLVLVLEGFLVVGLLARARIGQAFSLGFCPCRRSS